MQHYIFRSTTDKLPEHISHIVESGDRVVGDPVFVGGRDWVLLCRKGEPTILDLTTSEFEDLITRAVAAGHAAAGRAHARQQAARA